MPESEACFCQNLIVVIFVTFLYLSSKKHRKKKARHKSSSESEEESGMEKSAKIFLKSSKLFLTSNACETLCSFALDILSSPVFVTVVVFML